jgi:hypothetical protein
MLSEIVPLKIAGACATHVTERRHASGSRSERSTPSIVMQPPVGSIRARRSAAMVDLPAPLGPVTATVSPGSIVKVMESRTSRSSSGYRYETESNATVPGGSVAGL